MKLIEQLRLLERLDQLIRLKATGTPAELASRIEMSERQLYRRIQEFKDLGFPIEYCKECECYQYTKPVKLWFEVKIDEETALKIKGGQNPQKYWEDSYSSAYPEINRNKIQTFTSFFAPLPKYDSEWEYL